METNVEMNGTVDNGEPLRPSAAQMDENRYQQMAHEYLCRLREAREWVQTCLDDKLPDLIEFEESLRNGVILARLAHYVAPKVVREKDIFDPDQSLYRDSGLHFRHTDNVSRFLKMSDVVGLPKVFYPEIVDVYDKKNMPKVVYCIHALSIYLRKRFGSKFPTLTDVSSTARFTDEEISAMAKELAKYGITIPAFGKIGGLLATEMPIDQVALHAAIIVINETIDKGEATETLQALQNLNAHLVNVHVENENYYQENLLTAKQAKRATVDLDESLEYSIDATELYSHFLTRNEIQECIDHTNTVTLINEVNNALAAGDGVRLLKLLRHPIFDLGAVVDDHPEYYLWLLNRALSEKSGDDGITDLTSEEIRELILRNHVLLKKTIEKATLTIRINNMIESDVDKGELLNALHELDEVEQIGPIIDPYADLYLENLVEAQKEKAAAATADSEWFAAPNGDCILYININTGEVRTTIPDGNDSNEKYLNAKEIKEIIQTSNSEWNDLQARKQEAEAAKKIQDAWRSHHKRKYHSERVRKEGDQKRDEAARRIQSFYRKHKPKHDYNTLMNSTTPSLYVVQKFANLLNETDIDYEEELDIERLRKAIREEIQQHKKYEKHLDELDLQIGLLVRNRINVEKKAKHTDERGRRQSGSKRASIVELNGDNGKMFGFDLLTKSGRHRLHAYQNLLYLLSRHPKYLASIMVTQSASDANQFADNLIMPLFNYGTGSYDEYLLLQFFKTAMEEEIDRKVANLNEIQAVNLVSIDQAMKFILNSHGDQYNRDVLKNLVTGLLAVTDGMDTNPIDVYRHWMEELETRNGAPTGLPLDATAEQAMVHPEVQEKVHESILALERWVSDFLEAINKNLDKIPYCLRYLCKALRAKLTQKFPQEPSKAMLKMSADILFYRFIQTCVVPQAERTGLANDGDRTKRQKQATANVVKLLHCAIINKGYNDEYAHLVEFNGFIKECHQKFKNFFNTVCDVAELEDYFEIDEYIDYVTMTKPTIILPLGDLIKVHQVLVDNRATIADEIDDPLHELLNDFGGGRPSIDDIVGDVDDATRRRAESADLILTLTNKFEMPGISNEIRHEFLRTKKYIVDIILCQQARSVIELLNMPVSEKDEKKHKSILDSRRQKDQEILERLTLVEKKAAALIGLSKLEEAGLVSRSNDYSDIIASIAQDIRSRRRYRESRSKERARLLATLQKLMQKSVSYREQIDYYDLYLKACLNSMPAQQKKRDSLKRGSTDKILPPITVKYSGADLLEKGVLLSIDETPRNTYKNINFEIKNTSEPGIFEMTTKFMGASDMEVEEIVLQNLLQLQFENIEVTTLFGKVKVNVNKSIALLNKKFFAKHK